MVLECLRDFLYVGLWFILDKRGFVCFSVVLFVVGICG